MSEVVATFTIPNRQEAVIAVTEEQRDPAKIVLKAYARPEIVGVTASVDEEIGTPSVDVTVEGDPLSRSFDFAFHNLKGAKGDKGEKGDPGVPGSGAVHSVNSKVGDVVLTAQDVGALPDDTVIPIVNNATLTITQGGETKGTFTANASENATIELDEGGGSSRNVGEIVTSTIPLTDAGLHLLDGALILGGGIYSDFVDYIADLYGDGTNIPDYFAKDTYINVARATNAISSGSYSGQDLSNAFDGSLSTFWGCSQLGSNQINGVAYIGQSNLTKPIKKVRLYQSYTGSTLPASNICDVIKLQYSNDGTTWIDIQTVSNLTYQTWEEIDVEDYTPTGSTHSFRLLAMDFPYSTSGYNWIVSELELYVVQTAEEVWQETFAKYGVCDKFVYDSVNNTVRLPKYGNQLYSTNIPIKGNGIVLGLTNGTSNTGLTHYNGPYAYLNEDAHSYGVSASTSYSEGSPIYGDLGITTDSSKSGMVADSNYSSDVYYYIVIATTTKTEIEVDVDEIVTDLNGKADIDLTNCTKPHVVSTYSNGATWYRIYSDHWCEQGGAYSTGSGAKTITLIVPYGTNTNYFVSFEQHYDTASGENGYAPLIGTNKTGSVFSFVAPYAYGGLWKAEGYIIESGDS